MLPRLLNRNHRRANAPDNSIAADTPAAGRAPPIQRSLSHETVDTLVDQIDSPDSTDDDLVSMFTNLSEETMIPPQAFGTSITNYNVVRVMPIISSFLHSGVHVFSSMETFEKYKKRHSDEENPDNDLGPGDGQEQEEKETEDFPLLQTSLPMLSVFKKNAPFMVIYRYRSYNDKYEFCKVYFRVISSQVSYYYLRFNLDGEEGEGGPDGANNSETVILMNNNSNKPTVDLYFRNTKLRIVGITGTTSTFGGNGLIKMHIMKPNNVLLTDNMAVSHNKDKVKVSVGENALYAAVERQDRLQIQNMINDARPLVSLPLVTFIDEGGGVKMGSKYINYGKLKMFDSSKDIKLDGLILATIMLVMREQEYRKNKGTSKLYRG